MKTNFYKSENASSHALPPPSLLPSHILHSSLSSYLPVRKTMKSSRFHVSLSLQAESSLSDFSLLQCSTSDSLSTRSFNADSLSIQHDADSLSIQPFNADYLLLQSSSSDSLLEESSNDPHSPKQSSRHLIKSGKLGDKFFNFKLWRQLHQMGMETTNSSPKRIKRTKKKQKTEYDLELRVSKKKQKKKLQKQLLKNELAQITDDDNSTTELDLEIRALRKRNRKLINQILDDELAQITDDEESPKKIKKVIVGKEDSTKNFTHPAEQTTTSQEYFEPISDVKDEIILSLAYDGIQPEIQYFVELYLNYSESPSVDEVEEALIQVQHLGVDSLEELLDIVDKFWKESDSTADTVMENFVKQFPFIRLSPSFPFYHRLIVEVISYELKRSVTSSTTCSQNSYVSSHAPCS